MTAILPQSVESEKALIGCMLIDNSIISKIDLKAEDFYENLYFRLFKAVKSIYELKGKVDILVIKDFLKNKGILEKLGGMTFIVDLIESTPSSYNWREYLEIIKEKSNRRKIIRIGRKIEQLGFNEGEKSEKVLQKVKNMAENVFEINEKGFQIEDLFEKFGELYERYKNYGGLGYSSAHKELDKYTQGIIPGTVQTIVAYSNVGKSSFAYSYIPDLLKKGKKVLFLSNEVMADMLTANILRAYFAKTPKEIFSEDFVGIVDWEKLKNLKIYDEIFDLEEIKLVVENSEADVVFIDFIQNIQTGLRTEYEAMTKVAIELQRLAIKTGKTIFAISQANNESRFKAGEKIQPKGSGAIFASSDVILALSKEDKELKLNLLKNKFGPNDINFLVDADFSRSQFKVVKEIDQEDKKDENNTLKFKD